MESSRESNMNKRRLSNQNLISSEKKTKYDGNQNQVWIPLDMIIEVLKRLPVKTLLKFRCVSKLWSSIIRSPEFVNLFLALSSTRPRLLASFPDCHRPRGQFFSLRHLLLSSKISSSVANLNDLKYLFISKPVNGLVFTETRCALKICNPTTKQFITLPTPSTKTPIHSPRFGFMTTFFVYDSVDDQYKVLYGRASRMTMRDENKMIMEHQIFVLGENVWRRIQSPLVYHVSTESLSINGIMYFGASIIVHRGINEEKIVAFDVKHENYKIINIPAGHEFKLHYFVDLINFDGKLAVVDSMYLVDDNSITVWVLEDESKAEWLKKRYVLPSSWRDSIDSNRVAGLNTVFSRKNYILRWSINTGEIIIGPWSSSEPFIVVYYNLKTNSIRRVEIKGALNHEFKCGAGLAHCSNYLTIVEYVDSIKLLDGFGISVGKLDS